MHQGNAEVTGKRLTEIDSLDVEVAVRVALLDKTEQ